VSPAVLTAPPTSAGMTARAETPSGIPGGDPVGAARAMMGGSVSVHCIGDADAAILEAAAERVLDRLEAWSRRLTRFRPDAELVRLNADPRSMVPVGPTLGAVLDWAREAESMTDGLVDAALLDARLAAETGSPARPSLPASRRWSLERRARHAVVHREPGVRLDLDGVAKGWLADRVLAVTPGRSALVDADGDLAARVHPGDVFHVGVADPRAPGEDLVRVRLDSGTTDGRVCLGLATSGTSVHRWQHGGTAAHHLIDPVTGSSAVTDVVQATVLAGSARVAEAWAKAAVITGAERALALLGRPGIHGAVLLTTDGEVLATEGILQWLV
jgi:FAD:protein FMN transferase